MKLLALNDYVIWKKQKICQIVSEITRGPEHFLGLERPIAERYEYEICPPGMTIDAFMETFNNTSTWKVRDDKTGEEFHANGFDLIYVNEMMMIALMSRKEEG